MADPRPVIGKKVRFQAFYQEVQGLNLAFQHFFHQGTSRKAEIGPVIGLNRVAGMNKLQQNRNSINQAFQLFLHLNWLRETDFCHVEQMTSS